jgi:hypothetical protein
MSKPIAIRDIKIERPETGALPMKIRLFYSDNTKDELLGSFNDSLETTIKQVANHLLDINSPKYKHSLAKGHVRTLVKFKKAIVFHRVNSVHRRRDLDAADQSLTKDEEANLTYLRYHGLLVPDDAAEAGFWLITRKGNDFLTGQSVIDKFVYVKNNTVEGHDGPKVSVTDVWSDSPTWPNIESLCVEQPERREAVQAEFAL